MKNPVFTPKLYSMLRAGITRRQIFQDILSGSIVGIVALPLAIAFAIASGVPPERGLVTAVVAGFIISFLGGSRVQIGGPTGAFIVIVYAIVQQHGLSGLTIATFMAGFLIIGFGLLRLGDLLKFIPYPLIIGFTSGIAIIILTSQIKDLLGLPVDNLPADFFGKWQAYSGHLDAINGYALALGTATVLISFNFHRISKTIPGSLVAIVLGTLVTRIFNLPVETIASKFGTIPNHLEFVGLPPVDLALIRELLQPAFAIALLGGIESLLSAVVADGMIGGRHRSNMELLAQGAANIFSALFGGIPATGAIARTATNVKNGGRTPIAGITHALVLLLIMALFAPMAKLIPLSCLAGILVVVSWHMGEWHLFAAMLKNNRPDVAIMLTTFLLTVVFDLIIAIEIGIVLSSFIFMKRMSDSLVIHHSVRILRGDTEPDEPGFTEELGDIPEGVLLYEISGPLFFAAAQRFHDTLVNLHQKPAILILRMRHVPFIDATGMHNLKQLLHSLEQQDIVVLFSGVSKEVIRDLEKARFFSIFDRNRVKPAIRAALDYATQLLKERGTGTQ